MEILPKPCLALITNSEKYGEIDLDLLDSAVTGGVDMIQLREPTFPESKIIKTGNLIKEITRNRALLIFNGKPNIATKINADGVQLSENKMDTIASDIPKGLLIGRSIHSKTAALQSDRAGADFFIAGTVFSTDSHPEIEPAGVGLIGRISEVLRAPILGIGGITENNAESVINAGAHGIAVISSIWQSSDPKAAAKTLKQKLVVN